MFVYQPAVEGFMSLKVKVYSEGRFLAIVAEVGQVISSPLLVSSEMRTFGCDVAAREARQA